MTNLTFDEGLIREHTPEPLEGHVVVVLERVGDSGERFHSLIEPGGTPPQLSPRGYVAFAVDASRPRLLSFSEHVEMPEGGRGFELRFSVEYFVADPRLLVSTRQRDPLGQLRNRLAQVVTREIAELPRWDADSFQVPSNRALGSLRAYAQEYGIALTGLRLEAEFPASRMETRRPSCVREPRSEYRPERELRNRESRLRGGNPVSEGASGHPERAPPEASPPRAPAVRAPTSRGEVSSDDKLYRVWYATNRQPITNGAKTGYGGRVDTRVHFGSCDVVIPATHKIGELGSPWIRRFLSGTDDRLRLHDVVPMEEAGFWSSVREYAATFDAKHRHALVFIHGYRVSFRDAALRAAQLGYDLNVQGPVAFFSWPSRATLLGYGNDGSAAEASERAMTEFLTRFTRDCGADRVHVIAHSMGNRLLLRALQRIVAAAETTPAIRFGHLVLAAPDITRELFLDVADQYRRLSQRTTLYVSDVDRALRASFRLQGARVGLAPPITCAPGIDTVHVANVDRTLMGHSTFAEARPVLCDIHALLNHDAPPERRAGLAERGEGSERYWEVRA
jgi:esterase/lipase superfamily enzyme